MTDVPWLTSDEQRTWRQFLDVDRLLLRELDRQLQRDAGLALADYEILVRLSEAPGDRLRMSELAEATLYSRSRLSHAVTRLEGLGWVEREECPGDRRGLFAQLTTAGRSKLEAAAPGHVRAVRRHLFDPLNPEQARQLGEIAATLRRALEVDQSRSC